MSNEKPPWRSQKVWVLCLGTLVMVTIFVTVAITGGDIEKLAEALSTPLGVLFSTFLGARAVQDNAKARSEAEFAREKLRRE